MQNNSPSSSDMDAFLQMRIDHEGCFDKKEKSIKHMGFEPIEVDNEGVERKYRHYSEPSVNWSSEESKYIEQVDDNTLQKQKSSVEPRLLSTPRGHYQECEFQLGMWMVNEDCFVNTMMASKSSSSTITERQRNTLSKYSVGDTVKVIGDKNREKELLKCHGGWNKFMKLLLMEKGIVKFIYPNGDLQVEIKGIEIRLNRNCVVNLKQFHEENQKNLKWKLKDEIIKQTRNFPLHMAVWSDDYQLCCKLVEEGADINCLNGKCMSPIMLAAKIGCEDVLSLLVQRPDARLDIGDQENNTALHLATKHSNVNAVRILLDAGADIKAVNNEQFTPFHLAAMNGHEKILEFFLDKHGESLVDLQKDDQFAALHLATLNHRTACLRLLIGHNADLNIHNIMKQTALHIAVSQKYMDCVKILVESEAEVDLQDEDGNTPLHKAIHLHNINKLKKMIARFELQDMFMSLGSMPRSSDKPKDIAIYLAEHGASLDTLNYEYKSPLTLCQDKSLQKRLRKIQFELSQNVVDTSLCTGDEVFISITDPDVLRQRQAAHGGWNDAMKECLVGPCKLIELTGVDAVVKAPSGQVHRLNPDLLSKYTPGEWVLITWDERELLAAMDDDKTLKEMKSLLGQRVELVQKGQDGKCTVKHQSEVYTVKADCLMNPVDASNSSSSTITGIPLHEAVQKKNYRLCCQLIEQGADVNALNEEHLTPIMLAAKIGCEEVLSLLVQHPDARLDIGDKQNNTALHLAVKNLCVDAVRILLEENANVKAVNNEQFTPFHLAVQNGFEKILELFLDKHGASLVDLQKNDKFAALHLVTMNNNTACLRLVIKHKADLNIRNKKMQTALHIAVSEKYMDCVKILVESEAKLNLQDKYGDTPLHYAICLHNIERMNNMYESDGTRKFLFRSVKGNTKMKDIAIYLVEHGASMSTLNSAGKSPLTACVDQTLLEKLRRLEIERGRGLETSCEVSKSIPLYKRTVLYQKTMQRLQIETRCSICQKRANKVAFNCGHQACDGCDSNLYNCYVCRQRIKTRTPISS